MMKTNDYPSPVNTMLPPQGESLTAGLLAVDFLTWSRQVQRGKEMLATVERVADETGQAYPEYISNLLKAYQSCIKATDYEVCMVCPVQ